METTNVEAADPRWKVLYQVGGAVALSMVAIIVIQLIIFMTVPPPLEGTAIDWFHLFQQNRLIVLIEFELLMIIYTILAIPLTLALYVLLRRTSETFTALYLILSI